MINIYDNFIESEECIEFYNYCLSSSYHYGEVDDYGLPPTGMVSELSIDNYWYKYFTLCIKEKCKIDNLPHRAYINLFFPHEIPYYHIDGDGITFLYYPNLEWKLNNGGETQFFINNEIKGIPPIPNRAIIFAGNILHRATSFRDTARFTLAIKYSN